ncbi:non-hydrolyzing UDP-N-acetylglucosamine 2-epimerase [unidentified bacterial endosymbiont]|uniref:non-hydrolyzing UDP-N-acetylglucosamine 2-epimerase n=1 Tax=unidentified bacterial endosymbiont TaxID=2355 RepID=UPI00209CA0C2|nr:UDP-N-acetylglucosamine 2-epimerase (non-hydrolyzing) [unidentified bacterial endosymbiont]
MKSVLVVIGTRPEAIKLAPIVTAMSNSRCFNYQVCLTQQHTDLLEPVLLPLGISAHYKLKNSRSHRSLHQSAADILKQFEAVLIESTPDLVLVQGDTTSAFIAALAAFYSGIPVAHVEAGLRTGDIGSPWPEEGHRCLIDKLTTYFFAPTLAAQKSLLAEGAPPENVWVVGNTAIDAIRLARGSSTLTEDFSQWRVIVVTIHRRENHGEPLQAICSALRSLAEQFLEIQIVFVLHPNLAVRQPVMEMLSDIHNIKLLEPLDHRSFIQLLEKCTFLITDSGGIQEECSFLGKPILITRNTTERQEGLQAGTARLIGTKADHIVACCQELLTNEAALTAMSKVHFPYGDGYAAERIVDILECKLCENL